MIQSSTGRKVAPPSEATEHQRVLDESAGAPPAGVAPGAALRDVAAERSRLTLLVAIGLLALLLDQWSKAWIRSNLAPGEGIAVWPGVMHLSHVWNRGAAWGMLSGQRLVLVGFSVLVLVGVASMVRDFAQRGHLATVGLGLIVGGAIGNLIDRVLLGHVTDMFDMDTGWHWLRTFPVFNVADSALTVGVCLLLIHFVFDRESPTEAALSKDLTA